MCYDTNAILCWNQDARAHMQNWQTQRWQTQRCSYRVHYDDLLKCRFEL